AENLKLEIGSAQPSDEEKSREIRGRDLISGLPKTIEITTSEIVKALDDTVNSIIDSVKLTLEQTPPELAADIMDRGIVLTGGGALLKDLDQRLSEETQMPVVVADNPLDCVAIGTGQSLEN